jgi:catechol 2,3-dioxygenase-like lactoylglutathione lyase family enzyme
MNALFSGIEHVAIAARDPERLAVWYIATLDCRTRITFDNGPGRPKTWLLELGAGPMLEVFAADAAKQGVERGNGDHGFVHLAITVGDFDAAHARLTAAGARTEGDERSAPFGARVRFYRDPEGNLFHILFRPAPLPRESAG